MYQFTLIWIDDGHHDSIIPKPSTDRTVAWNTFLTAVEDYLSDRLLDNRGRITLDDEVRSDPDALCKDFKEMTYARDVTVDEHQW
jgi:uncharacterized membrane-anchored protein